MAEARKVHVTQFCVAQSRMQSSQSAAAAATKKAIKKKGKPATAQRPTVEHESSKIEDETPIEPPEEEARAPMPPPRKQPSFNLAAPATSAFAFLVAQPALATVTEEEKTEKEAVPPTESLEEEARVVLPPTKLHEQSAPAEKKSFANLAPSKRGRHDALAMTQRIEACEAELQHADSAVEDFAEALHVGGEWYRAEADTLNGTIERMRVSVTVELTDMRQTNESWRAGIEEELARPQRQAAEAQRVAERTQEACLGFRTALAAFMEQQARWLRCASTSDVPAEEGESAELARFRVERCWCAVEAAVAEMGEDFSHVLPLMRQAVAQVEWAVVKDEVPFEPLELPMPFDHREAHTSGSGTESEGAEGRDRDSQPREKNEGWEHATSSRRCRWPARAERRSLRRRRWKRLMRALRGKG